MGTRLQNALGRTQSDGGPVAVTQDEPDADPRISAPHKPIPGAPKFITGKNKIATPTPTRTVEWYERHGFKRA